MQQEQPGTTVKHRPVAVGGRLELAERPVQKPKVNDGRRSGCDGQTRSPGAAASACLRLATGRGLGRRGESSELLGPRCRDGNGGPGVKESSSLGRGQAAGALSSLKPHETG